MNDKNNGAPKTDDPGKKWPQPIPLDTTVQPMNGKIPRGTSGKSTAISTKMTTQQNKKVTLKPRSVTLLENCIRGGCASLFF